MSRGLGSFQREIVDRVESMSAPAARNILEWTCAEALGQITEEGIAAGFVSQFSRAIASLESRAEILRKERPLDSWDEFLRIYPFRSKQRKIRDLRIRLLPHLSGFAYPRYLPSDNEIFIRSELYNSNRELYKECAERWIALERTLVAQLANRSDYSTLLYLIAKGHELFGLPCGRRITIPSPPYLQCTKSFASLVDRLRNDLDIQTVKLLDGLVADALPVADRKRTSLKSKLFTFAEFRKSEGAPILKKEAKRELLRADPEYVRSLPFHRDPPHEPDEEGWTQIEETTYSPLLDRLVDGWAIADFEFITRCA